MGNSPERLNVSDCENIVFIFTIIFMSLLCILYILYIMGPYNEW